jgi:Helix-turn-helix domain of resolvase
MLRVDQVHVVRHKVLVEGQGIRTVAREMGISRNTVRRYLAVSEPVRSSMTSPFSSTMQIWLFTLCTSMPILSMAGLLILAALTARFDCGAFQLPRWSGGQPLHPIYPPRPVWGQGKRHGIRFTLNGSAR